MSKLGRLWDWLLPGLICLCPIGAIAYCSAGAEKEAPRDASPRVTAGFRGAERLGSHAPRPPVSSTQLDVVIIGGGIQGLLALNALVGKGYSCALVSDGDLGSGQTLHSHGYLNTGFGMFGPELPHASADVVQPYLEERGLELSHDWVMIPPPNMPLFEGLPTATLPSGFAAPPGLSAVGSPDRSVPKRRLVEIVI